MTSRKFNPRIRIPNLRSAVTRDGAKQTLVFVVKGLIVGVCITPVVSLVWMLVYFGLGYYSRYAFPTAAMIGIQVGLVSGALIGALRLRPLNAALWNMLGWTLFKGGVRWWKIYTGAITFASVESMRESMLIYTSFFALTTAVSGWLISKTLWDWLKEKES